MKSQLYYWIVMFSLSGFPELQAQSGSLPEQAMGSRSYAMGQSALLSFSDPIAVSMNPSTINRAQKLATSFFYTKGPQNTTNFSVGVVYPTLKYGSFGVSFFHWDTNGINQTNQGGVVDNISFKQSHLLLTYGKDFWKYLSIGASAKFVFQSLADKRSDPQNIGMDLGLQYNPLFSNRFLQGMLFGVSIDNLIKPSIKLINTEEHLPRELRIILENRFNLGDGALTTVGNLVFAEKDPIDSSSSFHTGLEYTYRNLSLRSGYHKDFWALGVGFRINHLVFNYVFSRFDRTVSKSQHGFSVSFEFGPFTKNRDSFFRQLMPLN